MTSSFDWDNFTPLIDAPDDLPEGQRWSTWGTVASSLASGPEPRPDWLVTSDAAIDTDLGIVKTGKEADVWLLERAVPGGESCLLAAKRYRDTTHRMFHRDTGYTEGRRVRRSRDARAMARKSDYGRAVAAQEWANAEFGHLVRLWKAGVPVPYPVQIVGTEILLEWIDNPDGQAAPRLAQLRPDGAELADLHRQLRAATVQIARLGFAHGDLSAYNVLVHQGRVVIIDVPQLVDVIGNPQGMEFLRRDVDNLADWFIARGLSVDAEEWLAELIAELY